MFGAAVMMNCNGHESSGGGFSDTLVNRKVNIQESFSRYPEALLCPPPSAAGSYLMFPQLVDDSNPAVQYAPGWEWETLVNEVHGTRHGAAKTGLSATLAFVGECECPPNLSLDH